MGKKTDWHPPVYTDGHQVEYGAGAAHHIHGDVEVAEDLGKLPHAPVELKLFLFAIVRYLFHSRTYIHQVV